MSCAHAISYARRGWPVFPCRITKRPYTQHGFKDATTDEGQLRSWWGTWPTAGIGIATGARAGFWVLDLDIGKGGNLSLESLEFQHGALPDTLRVRTGGGGLHLYFKWPSDRTIKNRADIEPGIDARGEGGYVLAPPSPHESGNIYSWELEDAEILDAPAWLLDLVAPLESAPDQPSLPVRNPAAYGKAALARAVDEVSQAREGQRNEKLNRVCYGLKKVITSGYVTRKQVETDLQLAAEQSGLPAAEARKTIASALGEAREPTQEAAKTEDGSSGNVLASGDPMTVGRYVLTRFRDAQGRLLLRRWRNDWWVWKSGSYRILGDEDLESRLWELLDQLWISGKDGPTRFVPSISKVANVKRALLGLATLVDSEAEPPVCVDDTPFSPSEIAVLKTGLLDLASGQLHPATPHLFSTTAIEASWSPSTTEPVEWIKFLGDIFEGDAEAIATLQEWFGYCLTADTSQQKILFVIGPKRSGKGTIGRILSAMLGRGSCAFPTLSSFGESFGLQPLLGKSVAIVGDARLSGKTDQGPIVERLLSISGEDSLTVNRKNQSQVNARLSTRLVILSNEIPRLMDASGALPSRMIVLQIRASFYGREDTQLERRLRAELGGILRWSVEGWRRLRARGSFAETPASARETVDDLEMLASPVRGFVEDCCVIEPDEWIAAASLYERWRGWCKDNGHDPGSSNLFSRQLKTAFPEVRAGRDKHQKQYRGINTRSAM
jgi:putative DNA primase/helicase